MESLRVGDLGRVQKIATILARHGFGQLLELLGSPSPAPTASTETETKSYARRLRAALTDLGPTFIKLGQVLSVRPDVLPPDVLLEFQSLQDRVPPMTEEDVRTIIEEELGLPIEQLFEHFDPEPLGSASIAQVHRARLRDGPEVAVKLQRRGIEPIIRSDLHILYALAQATEKRFVLPGLHTPTTIIREFHSAITRELDFHQELRATARMARDLDETKVLIPRVHPRWSTPRVLTMDLIPGKRLADAFGDLLPDQRRRLAHQLMDATYRQVFDHGFFHADPHPGNLMVTPDGDLAFLDFGVTGRLTASMQEVIINTFTSMVFRDPDLLAMTIYRAGATRHRIDLKAFRSELERKMVEYHGASLSDLAQRDTFVEVVQLATQFHIDLPPEYAVLARAVALVEATIRRLLPDVDIVAEVRPYAERLLRHRFAPDRVLHEVGRTVVQLQSQFRDLPTQMNQVLLDLEAGSIRVQTIDPSASALHKEIHLGVMRLSLAALASTITLGGFLFLVAWSAQDAYAPWLAFAGLLFLLMGLALFSVLGAHVLMARFLELERWRQRALSMVRFFRRPTKP